MRFCVVLIDAIDFYNQYPLEAHPDPPKTTLKPYSKKKKKKLRLDILHLFGSISLGIPIHLFFKNRLRKTREESQSKARNIFTGSPTSPEVS